MAKEKRILEMKSGRAIVRELHIAKRMLKRVDSMRIKKEDAHLASSIRGLAHMQLKAVQQSLAWAMGDNAARPTTCVTGMRSKRNR